MSILSLLMCLWRIKSIHFFKINIFDLTPFWTVMYYLLFVVWNFYNIFHNSVFVILINCAVNIKVCLCFPWYVPFKSCLPYSRSKSLNKEGKQLEAITLGRRRMCQAEGTKSNFPENTTSLYCLMPWVYLQLVYNFCADPHDLKWVRV